MSKPKTFTAYALEVYARDRQLAEHSTKMLRRSLNTLVSWLGYDPTLEELTVEKWKEFHQFALSSYAKSSARHVYMPAHAAFQHAARKALCEKLPNPRKKPRRLKNRFEPLPINPDWNTVPQSLGYILEKQYFPSKRRIRARHTRDCYRYTLRAFDLFLQRTATLDDLTDDTVTGFMAWLAETTAENGRKRSERTLNDKLIDINALWRWCAKKNLVNRWPTVEPLDEPGRMPKAYKLSEVETLLLTLRQQPGTIGEIPAGLWWESLYRTAFSTGERTTALLNVRCDCLDLETGRLIVPAEIRKARKKEMVYTLLPDALELLRRMAPYQRERIWELPRCQNWLHRRTQQIHKQAGLGPGGLQKMRRTFASLVEAAGGNATEALAHSSRSVTTKSYLDPTIINRTPANLLLPRIPLELEGKDGAA